MISILKSDGCGREESEAHEDEDAEPLRVVSPLDGA